VIRLDRKDIALALVAMICGGLALLVASGVLPMRNANDTPTWIIGLVGAMFVTAGAMIFLRNYSRLLDFFAALILAAFTSITGWIAFYGSADGFSGGIPFLPHGTNISLARTLFGLGGILCFLGFLYALKRFLGPPE